MPRLTMDKAGRVAVPRRIREKLHLEPGDTLELECTGQQIVLRPVQGTGSLKKKPGVWVFYSGNPLTEAAIDKALQKIRVGLPRTSEIAKDTGQASHQRTGDVIQLRAYGNQASGPMKAIELLGYVDEQHRLQTEVPAEVPAGPVRLILLLPDEDEGGTGWPQGVAKEWSEDLRDSRQDIYTLEDGQAVDAPR